MSASVSSYPPDGGLKEQVREFEDTPSLFKVLKDHFFGEKR